MKHKGISSRYFGGKGSSGTVQKIINCIRPADTIIEPYLGNGALIRNIRKANRMIGNDINSKVIAKWRKLGYPWLELYNQCAIDLLQSFDYTSLGKAVVYIDPPYPLSSRKSKALVYDNEMTDLQHFQLLKVAKQLPCDVLISSYPNPIYEQELKGWHRLEFTAKTSQGTATEVLWRNYADISILHDYSFAGQNYRERERIKRKAKRWVKNLKAMPAHEQQAIFEQLASMPEIKDYLSKVTNDVFHVEPSAHTTIQSTKSSLL